MRDKNVPPKGFEASAAARRTPQRLTSPAEWFRNGGCPGLVDAGTLVSFFVNGLVLGSITALAAIGLTLVYGILKLANFAHGDFLTLGAYLAFFLTVTLSRDQTAVVAYSLAAVLAALVVADALTLRLLGRTERIGALSVVGVLGAVTALNPYLAFGYVNTELFLAAVVAVVGIAAFSVGIDFLLWRPLRRKRATIVTFIIVSIGLALALRHVLIVRFGTGINNYQLPLRPPLALGPVVITQVQAFTIATAGIVILLVHVLLQYTRLGKSVRALGDNIELARISGIDVDRMIIHIWILAGTLAAVAGVLLAMNVNVNPNVGWNWILPIFAAVILGGIGSAYGAMLGGLTIGVAMELSVAWVPEYRLAVGFIILIIVLVIRPQGILGGKVS